MSLFHENQVNSVQKIRDGFRERDWMIATAESCTGGLLAALLTEVAGSSDFVSGGVIAYSNDVKKNVLGVSAESLNEYGAVSEVVAIQMVEGVKKLTGAEICVSLTGIMGPGGGSADKPVGTVWQAIATEKEILTERFSFSGERSTIRSQTLDAVLANLIRLLRG